MTTRLTVTESLAEIATLDKRIQKKRQFVQDNLLRAEMLRDPFAKQGGQSIVVERERQSIDDLLDRKVKLRMSVSEANDKTLVTVEGVTKSVSEWLIWRRDVAPTLQEYLRTMAQTIQSARQDAMRRGLALITSADLAQRPQDVIVNVDENALAASVEHLETVLGSLDGQLSLRNATTFIELGD